MSEFQNQSEVSAQEFEHWVKKDLVSDCRKIIRDYWGTELLVLKGRMTLNGSGNLQKRYNGQLAIEGTNKRIAVGYPAHLHEQFVSFGDESLVLRGKLNVGASYGQMGLTLFYNVVEIVGINDSDQIRQNKARLSAAINKRTAKEKLILSDLLRPKLDAFFEKDRKVSVRILHPETTQVLDDFLFSLGEGQGAFDLKMDTYKANNSESLAWKIRQYGQEKELVFLGVIRGGGKEETNEVFNSPLVMEELSNAQVPVYAALGHASDNPSFDQYSDEGFITPTEFGSALRDEYLEAKERVFYEKKTRRARNAGILAAVLLGIAAIYFLF